MSSGFIDKYWTTHKNVFMEKNSSLLLISSRQCRKKGFIYENKLAMILLQCYRIENKFETFKFKYFFSNLRFAEMKIKSQVIFLQNKPVIAGQMYRHQTPVDCVIIFFVVDALAKKFFLGASSSIFSLVLYILTYILEYQKSSFRTRSGPTPKC